MEHAVPSPVRGRHVCAVAPTDEMHARAAVRWIRDSLDAGLRTIWIERPGGRILRWLDREGVPWQTARAAGQLDLLAPGGILALDSLDDIPQRLDAARDLVAQALADGYRGVSVGVERSDALSVMNGDANQLAFESAWEAFTREHPLWLLCVYGPTTAREHIDHGLSLHPRELTAPLVDACADGVAVRLDGEVDLSNAELVGAFLRAAMDDGGSRGVALDLSRLAFIDLQGIRELVDLQRLHGAEHVRLVDPPRSLRRVLEVLGRPAELEIVEGAGR